MELLLIILVFAVLALFVLYLTQRDILKEIKADLSPEKGKIEKQLEEIIHILNRQFQK